MLICKRTTGYNRVIGVEYITIRTVAIQKTNLKCVWLGLCNNYLLYEYDIVYTMYGWKTKLNFSFFNNDVTL